MKRLPKFELYEDANNEFRWRLVSANKNIVAESGEGYKTKAGASRAIKSLQSSELLSCEVVLL